MKKKRKSLSPLKIIFSLENNFLFHSIKKILLDNLPILTVQSSGMVMSSETFESRGNSIVESLKRVNAP
jgi:hypothetical protein